MGSPLYPTSSNCSSCHQLNMQFNLHVHSLQCGILLRKLPTSSHPHLSNTLFISVTCCTPERQLLLSSFSPPLHNYGTIEEVPKLKELIKLLNTSTLLETPFMFDTLKISRSRKLPSKTYSKQFKRCANTLVENIAPCASLVRQEFLG